MAASFIYSPGGGRGTETEWEETRVSDLAGRLMKDSIPEPRLLPAAQRAALHGPELTNLLQGEIKSDVLELLQDLVGAVHSPEGEERSVKALHWLVSGENMAQTRLVGAGLGTRNQIRRE